MAVTLGCGLQKHQVSWQVHWRTANVPPLAMAVTVAGRLQKHQVSWQLRWCMASVPPLAMAVTLKGGLQKTPGGLAVTLMYGQRTTNSYGIYAGMWVQKDQVSWQLH